MSSITSISIRLKLRFYFIAIIALLTICFTLFFQDVRVMNLSYSHFNTHDVKMAEITSRIWSNIYEYRGLQHYHKDTEERKSMRELEKQLTDKERIINDGFVELISIAKGTNAEAKINETQKLWSEYMAQSIEFLSYSKRNDWEAASSMVNQTHTLFENITTHLDQMDSASWQNINTSSGKVYDLFRTVNIRLGLIAAAITVLLMIILFNVEGILYKLVQVTVFLKSLSDGNKNVKIEYAERKDEIGLIASSLVIFRDSMARVDELGKAHNRIKELQENKQILVEGSIKQFQNLVGEIIDVVRHTIDNLNEKCNGVFSKAEQTSGKSKILNSEAELAAKSLQVITEAMHQLIKSITEINHQVADSSRILDLTIGYANNGDMVANKLIAASDKIGEITNLMNSLTEQINLLALNATIEAARAGDAGKGFAVVAGEVKNLAQQAAISAEEVAKRIATIQSASLETSKVIKDIAVRIKKLRESTSLISAAIEAQEATTKEVASTMHQITEGTLSVTAGVNEISESAAQTGSHAYEIKSSSEKMAREVNELKSTIDNFLEEVRGDEQYIKANSNSNNE